MASHQVNLGVLWRRWQELSELLPDGLILLDQEGRIVYSSQLAEGLFGYDSGELLGQPVELLVPERLRGRHIGHRMRYALGPSRRPMEGRGAELLGRRKDGTEFPVDVSLSPVKGEQGFFVLGIVRDVTARRRIEQEMHEQRERLRAIAEATHDAIVAADQDGCVTYWNPGAEAMFGYGEEEMEGRPLTTLMPERFREAHQAGMRRFLDTGRSRVIGKTVEVAALRRDGAEFPMELSLAAWKDAGRTMFAAIIRDISDRKRTEENFKRASEDLSCARQELIQAEKMASLGLLASGVAHEVKNPLGILLQGVAFLEGNLRSAGAESAEVLEMMKKAVGRADKIIRSLLHFARPEPLVLRTDGIASVIEESLRLVQGQFIAENVHVVKDLPLTLPMVKLDANRMEQVFVNLLLNAFQAMPAGGQLTLRAYAAEPGKLAERAGRRDEKSGKLGPMALVCEMRDTGAGISQENLRRVFDPFFSTKSPGQGTGLGLSLTRAIVEAHGGWVWLESEQGRGTCAIIALPVAEGGEDG